jgi:hypothetical protein
VLAAHYQTHAALAPQDIYKLIYQRVFGPEHSLGQPAAARERLYLEILQLPQTSPSAPLLEPLSSELCRVNLHPFLHSGRSVEALWQVFRQTARTFRPGTLADVQRDWSLFCASAWAQQYPPELLEQFWQRMATEGFPPVHHSRAYTAANAPHYRVVLRALAAEYLGLPL